MFECSVHGRQDLTAIQKFTYLKGQLEGEAAQLIAGFNLEAASYEPAVNLLKETYGGTDRIKASHISAFCSLEAPSLYIQDLICICLRKIHCNLGAIKGWYSFTVGKYLFLSLPILSDFPDFH